MARKFREISATEEALINHMYSDGFSAETVAKTVRLSLNLTLKVLKASGIMRTTSKGIKTKDISEFTKRENELQDTVNNAFNIAIIK